MTELIISVSGLRGVVGQSLTVEVAQRYASAFAEEAPDGAVVISRDGRASGEAFTQAIAARLTSMGRAVLDAGVSATPTVGVLVRTHRAAGGIQVSASHNPVEYNGLKLFSSEGRVLPAAAGQRVLDRFRASESGADGIATRTAHRMAPKRLDDATSAHLERLESICEPRRIAAAGFRVLLDANRGAGGALGRQLLERLGCEVEMLGGLPDGQFEHVPEPTEGNLSSVLEKVVASRSAAGFCQDPDADRLAIIDEQGRYLGEEKTLAICVNHVLRSGLKGPIVTNCSTSRMSEDLAAKYGVPFFRSKVGEANVVDAMLSEKALLGGEGNGGVIDPRVGLVRDSFAGIALILDAMATRGLPVSALADELPSYAIHKTTIAAPPGRLVEALAAIRSRFPEATVDRLDGLRLDWSNGAWLLVRPSNTEPIVRAIAEAPSLDQARSLCQEAAAVVNSL